MEVKINHYELPPCMQGAIGYYVYKRNGKMYIKCVQPKVKENTKNNTNSSCQTRDNSQE